MEDVLARLSREGEEFLEGREPESFVEIRDDEIFLVWENEFDRIIYNEVYPNERVEVGIILVDENPTGSFEFLEQEMSYLHPETASSYWSFCYETANQYELEDLETIQAERFYDRKSWRKDRGLAVNNSLILYLEDGLCLWHVWRVD